MSPMVIMVPNLHSGQSKVTYKVQNNAQCDICITLKSKACTLFGKLCCQSYQKSNMLKNKLLNTVF